MVYLSRDIGLFVVLVARNRAVNLKKVNFMSKDRTHKAKLTSHSSDANP